MKNILIAIALFVSLSLAHADVGFSQFASGGTALNAGTNYVIIPSQSVNGGAPVVSFLSATATTATSQIKYYISTNSTTCTLTNTTTTNFVALTNGFLAGDVVVVQHTADKTRLVRWQCERLEITSLQATNQIVFTTAPIYPVIPGDLILKETSVGTIPVGNATITLTGQGIITGARGKPFLIDLFPSTSSATTATINSVNANYVQ